MTAMKDCGLSGEVLERRAREFVKPFCTESDDHDWPQHNCRKCAEMAERLHGLLDAIAKDATDAALEKADEIFKEIETWQLNFLNFYGVDAASKLREIVRRGRAMC